MSIIRQGQIDDLRAKLARLDGEYCELTEMIEKAENPVVAGIAATARAHVQWEIRRVERKLEALGGDR